MTGDNPIAVAHSAYNQKILFGCSVIILLSLFGLAFLLVSASIQERQAARYPGSFLVASHSNYNSLPSGFRWDDTYRTTDNFTDVYNWYSITFGLGAEARAIGRCLLLEGTRSQFTVVRSISVFVCNTPTGQMIFVSRTTYLK